MLVAIIPERAKMKARQPEDALAEWEAFKIRWTKQEERP